MSKLSCFSLGCKSYKRSLGTSENAMDYEWHWDTNRNQKDLRCVGNLRTFGKRNVVSLDVQSVLGFRLVETFAFYSFVPSVLAFFIRFSCLQELSSFLGQRLGSKVV